MSPRFSLRRALVVAGLCTLIPNALYAEDAVTGADDATAAVDAGAGDAVAVPDAGPASDASTPGDTASGSFNTNPCWDQKCAKETDACKADADCLAVHNCGSDQACVDKVLNNDSAKSTKVQGLMNAISDCGWKSCNDPTKGSCKDNCGKYNGETAPCNCDLACTQYGDCCQDMVALCMSCKGHCTDGATACGCDDTCDPTGQDTSVPPCCDDKDASCPSTPVAEGSCKNVDCTKSLAKGKNADGTAATCYCDSKCAGHTGGCCKDQATACGGTTPDTDAGLTGTGDGAGSVDIGGDTPSGNGAVGDGGASSDSKTNAAGSSAAAAKSSGCTAGSRSQSGAGLLLALGTLMCALALRRRFV